MAARKRRNQQPRCMTPMNGWQPFLFGSILTAVSIPILWFGPAQASRGVPPWIVQAVGGCFLAVGLLILLFGFRQWRRRRRQRDLLEQRPGEAWYADHDWDPQREYDDNSYVGFATFMVFFLSPFNWWAFVSDYGLLPVKLIVGLFDLVLVCLVGVFVYRVVQILKYGRAYVRFGRFPYRLGEVINLHFGMRHDLRSFDRIKLQLRFVEEVFENTGHGQNRSARVAAYELWSDEEVVEMAEIGSGLDMSGGEVEVSFQLPANHPEYLTSLAERPPKYWELWVHAEAIGVDFDAVFPLPVYLPPVGEPEDPAQVLVAAALEA
ncbi:MAG: hypothetical protein ACYTFN_00675 [Planctomycetota bacterium]|jgi:hypothetical protein